MFSRRLKTGYFALEGLNSFATVYYFYYLYFYMQKVYGFGNQANLMLAALNGATYALMAWFGGKFAQRYGYFPALKLGYLIMVAALGVGLVARTAIGHVWVMILVVVGMSFTWPTLEALVSEGESRTGLQHMVGVYNVVWAATAALGNFTGGAILEKLGLKSLFAVPMAIHLCQLGLTYWLESIADTSSQNGTQDRSGEEPSRQHSLGSQTDSEARDLASISLSVAPRSGILPLTAAEETVGILTAQKDASKEVPEGFTVPHAKRFLRMAWLANPFAYIAINTLIAVMPGIAQRLQLSTMAAGFTCSTWCFARLAAFILLWRWTAWHYRFRWMLLSYAGLVAGFGAAVLTPGLLVLVLAQLVFGGAVGLLYYSSLFYSMDRSETKGEHGGIHEAVIGLGNCAGPAVGATALQLLPQYSHSGAVAVITLLLCGLAGLLGIWRAKPDSGNQVQRI
jgi:predicted MFS family arabinose efflux permease